MFEPLRVMILPVTDIVLLRGAVHGVLPFVKGSSVISFRTGLRILYGKKIELYCFAKVAGADHFFNYNKLCSWVKLFWTVAQIIHRYRVNKGFPLLK